MSPVAMSASVTPALATDNEPLDEITAEQDRIIAGYKQITSDLSLDQPSMSWLKDELLNYALNLDLDVNHSMTKAQILAAIQAA